MNDYDEWRWRRRKKRESEVHRIMNDYDELVNWLSENHHEVFCQWAQVVEEEE